MNPNNYCTLEAAKRLVDAGIVLETEAGWYKIFRPGCHTFDMILSLRSGNDKFYGDNYPAPSMAEVWMELPKDQSEIVSLLMNYWSCDHFPSLLERFIYMSGHIDALIDFLIWQKGRDNGKS